MAFSTSLACGALALVVALMPVRADTLLTLMNPSGVAIPITDTASGIQNLTPGSAIGASWTVVPGDAIDTPTRPGPWRVDFYQLQNGNLRQVAAIDVRYDGPAAPWMPSYVLDLEMFFMPTAHGWVPISVKHGHPTLLDYSSPAGADAEGAYPSFTFRSTQGPLEIDAWAAAPDTPGLTSASPGMLR